MQWNGRRVRVHVVIGPGSVWWRPTVKGCSTAFSRSPDPEPLGGIWAGCGQEDLPPLIQECSALGSRRPGATIPYGGANACTLPVSQNLERTRWSRFDPGISASDREVRCDASPPVSEWDWIAARWSRFDPGMCFILSLVVGNSGEEWISARRANPPARAKVPLPLRPTDDNRPQAVDPWT